MRKRTGKKEDIFDTSLHIACLLNCKDALDLVKLLLQRGANVNAVRTSKSIFI